MEIEISLPDATPKQEIINLKNYIERETIDGLAKVNVERVPHGDGQLGIGDLLNTITAIITATAAIIELIQCVQKYANKFRVKPTISSKNVTITLEQGKTINPEELKVLLKDVVATIPENNT